MPDENVSPTADPEFMWRVQSMFRYDGPYSMGKPEFRYIGFAGIPVIEVAVWLPEKADVGNILPLARTKVMEYLKNIPDALEYVQFRPSVGRGYRRVSFIDQSGKRRFGLRHEIHFYVEKPLADHLAAIKAGTISKMDIERLGLGRRRPVRVKQYLRRRRTS